MWKSRTECAFDESEYYWVIRNAIPDGRNIQMNQVYSQLAVATVGGTVYHLVKKYEGAKYENSEWNDLCQWHDGDAVKNEREG